MHKFERLVVWQKSLELIKSVYDLCARLPAAERGNIIDQIKRSAVSVSSNIAEGSGSQNDKEFKRYLYIARKSLFEVVAMLKIAELLYKVEIDKQIALTDEVGKLINGLVNRLKVNGID